MEPQLYASGSGEISGLGSTNPAITQIALAMLDSSSYESRSVSSRDVTRQSNLQNIAEQFIAGGR